MCLWNPSSLFGKISRRESDALRTLFNAANGGNWNKNNNWKGAPGTEHTWYGITCNPGNTSVLGIDLRSNNLQGTLPADLGGLANLRTLILRNNRLTTLHKDLSKLSKLTTLDLGNNRLSGPIPPWIGRLKNLKKLYLNNNGFNGRIPSWIGSLTNLEELHLDGNLFSGPIPARLGNLRKLTVLRIGHNKLTGEIPTALRKLTRLSNNRSNFKWNGLYTGSGDMRAFLNSKQNGKDWESTQTVAPSDITAFSPTNNSIELSWEPIAYSADSGGYKVFYSGKPGGPYKKFAGETDDKTRTEITVKELEESTTYYFVIRTRTDGHGSNRNSIESGFGPEKAATTRGTTISGKVKTSQGQEVAGVELRTSESEEHTFTDDKGIYNLGVSPGWSGTVTPSKKGFDFSPQVQKYNNVTEDQEEKNYTAEAITKISGRITDSKGGAVPGVSLSFSGTNGNGNGSGSGSNSNYAQTDSRGDYTHTVPYRWTGTVTPAKSGYRFDPPVKRYMEVMSAVPGNVYQAFRPPQIRGRAKNRGGKAVPGVTVTFTGSGKNKNRSFSLKTGERGEYSKVFADDWSGAVKASKPGYILYPAKRHYKGMTRDIVKEAEHFKAEQDLKFFLTLTGNYMVPAQDNFSEIYGGGALSPGVKAGYKFYRSFYLWAGYEFLSKNGATPLFEEESKWKEAFLSGGIGYHGNMSAAFAYKLEIGLFSAAYTEEAFGEEVTGSGLGAGINGALVFKAGDRLFMEFFIGYITASDNIENDIEDITLKLGGLRGGVGLGIRF
jgi:hypothetical protein